MRAVGLHADVLVVSSRVWQTTCTAVRSGSEAFVIDSPVYPDELELLPTVLEQAGFAVAGLLVTHADWDHLLGRLAFPEAPIGCSEATGARLRAEPGAAQRALRAFDEEHYVQRPRPLGVSGVQAMPVPGYCGLGDAELELHEAAGHTADGTAVWIGWASVLVCGDYLSPVELPMLSPGGSLDAYAATLDRLAPLVERAAWVVPGHGAPLTGERARVLLDEDRTYVDALRERGTEATPPPRRDSARQREIHRDNAARVGA